MPKAKLAWPFQERRISMQGSCRTRYDLQVWRHLAAVHTKTALSSSVTYSGLWRLPRTFKFSHLTNLVPPNHNAQQQDLSRRELPPAWPRAPLLEGCTSPIALYHGHNKRSSIQQFPFTWRTLAHSPEHASASLLRKLITQLTSRNRHHQWDSSAGNNKGKWIKQNENEMYQLYPLFCHKVPLIHCFNSTSSRALNKYPQHIIFS